ncbi:iron-sulfur cluster-binding domain-containing protein [Chitinophaga sp. Cy-1792]|uniref:iron-sulfur cluster-binding domain-containing protein n=1 Tax=Chitinophaga sp. Cy-1792 TaxID=2608339 RepID=UPI001422EC0F|nr:iron-sulfur cluster-binding domain-containing protein [Chitinophaga sp. Cy-1792]NIG52781.1 iron-sulfur cluster-binding domain-containing protein [Chitinophaga sp. Cy-1792]
MYLQLRIKDIIRETEDTRTYVLENTDATPIHWLPGQFLTFLITLHGITHRRSYSISTTPGIDPLPAITVRRKENGEISRHILHDWQTGDVISAIAPSGRFTPVAPSATPRDIFLLAAGSGISPVFSILNYLLREEPTAHIKLIYSNSSPDRTIFLSQIQSLEKQYPEQLQVIYLYSGDPDATHTYRRLSNLLLETMVKQYMRYQPADAHFYLCGPPDYMRMIMFTLTFAGFSQDQLHKENFVVNTAVKIEKTGIPDDSSLKALTIRLNGQDYELKIPGNKTILQHALENSIALPYSCKGGVCGSCTARCSTGKINMSVNEVLTDREIGNGYILTCVGYVKESPATIEI